MKNFPLYYTLNEMLSEETLDEIRYYDRSAEYVLKLSAERVTEIIVNNLGLTDEDEDYVLAHIDEFYEKYSDEVHEYARVTDLYDEVHSSQGPSWLDLEEEFGIIWW